MKGFLTVLLVCAVDTRPAEAATVFLETMAANAVKPWPGTGACHPWTVAYSGGNPFEQTANANYGSGNACGLTFKGGTTNLSDSMITTLDGMDASGNSGTVDFYIQTSIVSSNAGWALQLNPGTGFTTRLSGQTTASQGWQLYSYSLQPGDLVSNLTLRFQFSEGNPGNRIFLDQISVTTQTGTTYVAGSFTPQYVHIDGGSFVMGDHFDYVDPLHPSDEIPLHDVYISPLYMATTLLTCSEYCDYLNDALEQGLIEVRSNNIYAVGGNNIYCDTFAAYPYSRIQYTDNTFTVLNNRELHPITGLRWFGAIAYCNWLSQRDGFEPAYDLDTGDVDFSKNGFRLPTEAEWEYCARGGLTNPYYNYPWGADTNASGTFANWDGTGDPFESTSDYPCTTPVGFYNGSLRYKSDYDWPGSQATYQTSDGSNPFGLYDMEGNVWQWVNDWYDHLYYTNCVVNNIVTNPPGPATGDVNGGQTNRCARGGCWNAVADLNRVSNRIPAYWVETAGAFACQAGLRVMRPDKAATTVGLFLNTTNAYPGYTLFSPMADTDTYLINNDGQCVHKWTSSYPPGRADCLWTNGHLFRACGTQSPTFTAGGEGGRVEERDWLGNLVWAFDYNYTNKITHHDFKILPNGNLIMIAQEQKMYADLVAAGFTQLAPSVATNGGFTGADYVIEVQPTRPYGGNIVWEWHVWDHLIQDVDSNKFNYGVVTNHPELFNVNQGQAVEQFWNHMNSIAYNEQLDQIVLSVRNADEFWVIDHSTTTAEAASHAGGTYGQGGDILYRWGNPKEYKLGTASDEMLWAQHDVQWIPANCPGAGHILIHNNGEGRGYTTIDEMIPPVESNGSYTRTAGAAFGPTNVYWTYKDSVPTNFYAADIGGAQRLPNGNTLITYGIHGNFFEVTSTGQIVWQYQNPVNKSGPMAQGSTLTPDAAGEYNSVFKVHRYDTNFVGFIGKDLAPRGTIETYNGASTDTDGDGLPDVWERTHFSSLSSADDFSDSSTNGLTDLQEYNYGLNPTVWSSASNGIPDGWAVAYGFDPASADTADLSASNGNTVLQCYLADLNPTNVASRLAITGFSIVGNDAELTWIGGSSAWQSLECTSDLVSNQWSVVYTNVPPTPVTNNLFDSGAGTNRFYRIKAWR